MNIVDDRAIAAPDTINLKLLPRTSLDTLDEASATIQVANLSTRPYQPLRPGNVTVESVARRR